MTIPLSIATRRHYASLAAERPAIHMIDILAVALANLAFTHSFAPSLVANSPALFLFGFGVILALIYRALLSSRLKLSPLRHNVYYTKLYKSVN